MGKVIRLKIRFAAMLACLLFTTYLWGQTPVVAEWNFEDTDKRSQITNHSSFVSNPYTADEGSELNKDIQIISLHGGATFSAWVLGSEGSGSQAPNSTNWQDGANSKYWQVRVSTLGFEGLTVSSKQQSSGTGPRDFKLQFSLDGANWEDVPGASFTVANNFTSGVLNKASLPEACGDQPEVFLRWVMTSNVSVDNGTVAAGGTNRIDQIIVHGYRICDKHESFYYSNATASYSDGSFTGDDGVEWFYYHSRNEGNFPIDGKGLIFRSQGDSSRITANIDQGISAFSVQLRKAYTSSTTRQVALFLNGELIATSQTFGNFSGEDETVFLFEVNEINMPGEISLELRNIRGTSNNPSQLTIDNISWSCYIEPVCVSTFNYYRSKASGYWEDTETWESSTDNVNWNQAECPPDYRAAGIVIRNGHTVTINEFLRTNQTIIESGGTLVRAGGLLVIHDGPGDDLTVFGTFRHAANLAAPKYEGTIRVKTGGVLEVTNNATAASHYGTSNRIFYEDGSVFYWNVGTTALFQTVNVTYFVNSGPDEIPVFRVRTPNILVGSGSPTTINGVFEVMQNNVTWQHSGTKTFRNGITGAGAITQGAGAGPFHITGTNAVLGGSGALNLSANGLKISGAASLTSDKTITGGPVTISGSLNAGSHTLSLGGDLSITESGNFTEGTSTLAFIGATKQNLAFSELLQVYNLSLSNPEGLDIHGNLRVYHGLTMAGGNIFTGGDTLEIGVSPGLSGILTHTSGAVLGPVKRWFSSTTGQQQVFPVGTLSSYNPATVEFTQAPEAGFITGQFITQFPENYYGNLPFTEDSITFNNLSEYGYWQLDAGGGLAHGTYSISVNASGFPGIQLPENVRILRRDTGADDWKLEGAFSYSGTPGNYTFTHAGMTNLSEFALAGNAADNPLPIELIAFSAHRIEGQVLLSWSTASETNNDFFTLERSHDTRHAEVIATLPGAGNSNQTLHYHFTDIFPLEGISYYRLKQTDFDGSYEYSPWIVVEATPAHTTLHVSLMSAGPDQWLQVISPGNAPLEVLLTDIYGRVIFRRQFHRTDGITPLHIPLPRTGQPVIVYRIGNGSEFLSGKVLLR
jgi:hypothetical protein